MKGPRTGGRHLRALVPLVLGAVLVSLPAWAAVVNVSTGNFYYDVDGDQQTDTIHAEVGDQLRFVIEDNGPGTPHTVEVDELDIHSGPLRAGETFTTRPLSQAGTFRLYCDPHENRGHVTTLVVAGEASSSPSPSPSPEPTASPAPTSSPAPTAEPSPTSEPPPTTQPTSEPTSQPTSEPTSDPTGDGPSPADVTSPTPASPDATTDASPAPSPPAPGGPGPDSDQTLAPVGRGTADPSELAASPAPGSLDDILGRSPRDPAPWTRAVWLGLVALLPLGAIAGGVLIVSRRRQARAASEDADRPELRP